MDVVGAVVFGVVGECDGNGLWIGVFGEIEFLSNRRVGDGYCGTAIGNGEKMGLGIGYNAYGGEGLGGCKGGFPETSGIPYEVLGTMGGSPVSLVGEIGENVRIVVVVVGRFVFLGKGIG